MYFTSDKEMEELIERNGFFSIEMVKLGEPLVKIDEPVDTAGDVHHAHKSRGGGNHKETIWNWKIIDEIFYRTFY